VPTWHPAAEKDSVRARFAEYLSEGPQGKSASSQFVQRGPGQLLEAGKHCDCQTRISGARVAAINPMVSLPSCAFVYNSRTSNKSDLHPPLTAETVACLPLSS
jgi:hypothetical protein